MKKTVLIAFTVIAVLLLLFSVFLCFTENVRLSSMGTKIEEKLDSLTYGDSLRTPNTFTFVGVFFNDEKLASFIEVFDAAEGFWFPMLAGAMMLLCTLSAVSCILVPAAVIFFIVLVFLKKTVLSIKIVYMAAAAGSILVITPYAISLVLLQKIYETATFKFDLINVYLVLAITVLFFIVSMIIVGKMKIADDYKVKYLYSEAAFERGGILEGQPATTKKSLFGKKAKKVKNTDPEARVNNE